MRNLDKIYDEGVIQNRFSDLRKLNKKYRSKGPSIYTLRRRVFNSAVGILSLIEEIPFADLSWDLYFLIKDKNFSELANSYKAVLEVAKMQPDKFLNQLYEFYRQTAKKIKEKNLVRPFFEFLSILMSDFEEQDSKVSAAHKVYVAYLNLLLEQTEFLRTNLFDVDKVIVGINTKGKLMEITDVAPGLDTVCYSLEEALESQNFKRLAAIQNQYHFDLNEAEMLITRCQTFDNNVYAMTPYISEYTMDIVPVDFIAADIESIINSVPKVRTPIDTDVLMHKRRTLPTNGLVVEDKNKQSFMHKTLLKEIIYNGEVVILYKLTTALGEMSGFYRKSDNTFYSIAGHSKNEHVQPIDDVIKNLVLWAYTAYVCGEQIDVNTESYISHFYDYTAVDIAFVGKGGKLRVPSSGIPRQLIAYQDGYETEVKYISGYIRNLPSGQSASQKAIDAAKALGYDLLPCQTYVNPFERTAWIKKK